MDPTFKNRSKQSLWALLLLSISLHIAAAFPVGPQLPEESQRVGSTKSAPCPHFWDCSTYPRLNIPKLDLAVVVIDPGLNESDDRMRELGVWPEIRKIEGINLRITHWIQKSDKMTLQFDFDGMGLQRKSNTAAPSVSIDTLRLYDR